MQGWSVDWFGKPRKALQSCRTLLGYANRTTCQPCKDKSHHTFSVSSGGNTLTVRSARDSCPHCHPFMRGAFNFVDSIWKMAGRWSQLPLILKARDQPCRNQGPPTNPHDQADTKAIAQRSTDLTFRKILQQVINGWFGPSLESSDFPNIHPTFQRHEVMPVVACPCLCQTR